MLKKTPPPTRKHRIQMRVSHRSPRPRPQNFSTSCEVLPSPVILVVSHDTLLRWALHEALTAASFRVLVCNDEPHAREILPKVDVDFALAIIDDESWPMTARERHWLHSLWPELPIVVLAHPDQGLEHRVEELGLAEVVLKPFDVSQLVQTVERLLAVLVRTRHHIEHAKAG
jgi:DNA-binding NtrC family response regulator